MNVERDTLQIYYVHDMTRLRPWARSIGLMRIRRTPPFSDDAFDWAQLNPDESSELIHLIRKKLRTSSDELDTRTHPREDVMILRLPHSDLNQTVAQHSSSHLISSCECRRWMSLPNPDEPNQTRPMYKGREFAFFDSLSDLQYTMHGHVHSAYTRVAHGT